MARVPQRFGPILLALFQSGMMVLLVSGVVTAINRGVGNGYFAAWMRAFLMAWPVAFTGALISRPIAVRMVSRLTS